ncbi:mandelate racemase/muconate lactonizing enzyme family protein [Afifella pfennigii]|uniref:mandelate racemase/muconate lactonizing enzyme family protein n=1 Tax=Afifella pfennigii TaxID=209897 RepID=UPI00047D4D64|nr:enolase C-terminal domain-like protein [Afifella pfennigii]
MSPAPIARIEIFRADLALAEPFEHASSGRIDRLQEILVKLTDADGIAGWGEMRGNVPYVTGETPGRVLAALTEVLAPRLLEARLASLADVLAFMDKAILGNATAKAVVDVALHDVIARRLGVPVQALLGGGTARRIRFHGTLPFCPPEEAANQARRYLDAGVTKIKVRVALRPVQRDLARLEAIRRVLDDHPAGKDALLAVDANQGWRPKEAIGALRLLERFDLAWIEQPVAAGDLAGMRAVKEAVAAPVIADESCGTPQELLRLIETRAVDGFHFKLCKAGGIRRLMGMIATAEAAGMPYMIGQMDEGMLATAAGLNCAAAANPFSCELWGYQRVAAQPFTGLKVEGGAMVLPDAPGFGIDVDEAALTPIADFPPG